MNKKSAESLTTKSTAMAHWKTMLRDDVALLRMPGAHHKMLLRQAHVMHRSQIIDNNDLSDLLELADGALAFAVESLLDFDREE